MLLKVHFLETRRNLKRVRRIHNLFPVETWLMPASAEKFTAESAPTGDPNNHALL
jgi:hypothetical protein